MATRRHVVWGRWQRLVDNRAFRRCLPKFLDAFFGHLDFEPVPMSLLYLASQVWPTTTMDRDG